MELPSEEGCMQRKKAYCCNSAVTRQKARKVGQALRGPAIEKKGRFSRYDNAIDAMSNGDTSFISDRFNERPHVWPGLAALVTIRALRRRLFFIFKG